MWRYACSYKIDCVSWHLCLYSQKQTNASDINAQSCSHGDACGSPKEQIAPLLDQPMSIQSPCKNAWREGRESQKNKKIQYILCVFTYMCVCVFAFENSKFQTHILFFYNMYACLMFVCLCGDRHTDRHMNVLRLRRNKPGRLGCPECLWADSCRTALSLPPPVPVPPRSRPRRSAG